MPECDREASIIRRPDPLGGLSRHEKLLLLLLLYDIMDVSCHRPFLPGTSLEPAVIPTAQASSITLRYFPYYV